MYGQGSYQDYDDGLDYEVEQAMEQYFEPDEYGGSSEFTANDWFTTDNNSDLDLGVHGGQAIDIVVGPVRDRLHYRVHSGDTWDYNQADYLDTAFEPYDERGDLYDNFEDYHEDGVQGDTGARKISLSKPAEPPVIEHFNQDSAQDVTSNNTKPDPAPGGDAVSIKNIFRHRTNRLGRVIEQSKPKSSIQIKPPVNDAPKSKIKAILPVNFSKNIVQTKGATTKSLVADDTQSNKITDGKKVDKILKPPISVQVEELSAELPVVTNYQENDPLKQAVETDFDSKDDLLVEFKSESTPDEENVKHDAIEAEEKSHDAPSMPMAKNEDSDKATENEDNSKHGEHKLSQSLQPSLRSEAILANNLLNIDQSTDSEGSQSKTASSGGTADEDAEIMAMFDTDSYISPIKLRKSKVKARISLVVIFILLAVIIAGGIYLYTAIIPNI